LSQVDFPLVSVGIPTYNRPESLRRTLASITKQTYLNIEIIVSDNASTDPKVQQVITEFVSHDSRIINVRQSSNIGMIGNFKFVLQKAKGDFFMWAADDDYFEADFIEICMEGVQSTGTKVALSTTAALIVNKDGSKTLIQNDFETINLNAFERIKKTIHYCIVAEGQNVQFYGVYNKAIISEIVLKKNWHRYWGVDVVTMLALCDYGTFAHNKNYPGFHYFLTGESGGFENYKGKTDINFSEVLFLLRFPWNFFRCIFKMKSINLLEKLRLSVYTAKCFQTSNKGKYFSKAIYNQTRHRLKHYILGLFKGGRSFQ
jgi:glycosyltransferase involved in cell wall biosynthesis